MDRDDLHFEIDRIIERLDDIERRQRLANSRIRQDVVGVAAAIVACVASAVIFYNEWPIWIACIVVAIGLPSLQAWLVSKVQDQEEPAHPRLK